MQNMKYLAATIAFAAVSTLGGAQIFSGSGSGGAIPDGSGSNVPGAPLTTTATISGATGPILNAWVDFSALAHTWVGDMTIRLIHPNNVTSMYLVNRPGRGSASTFGFSGDFLAANSYGFRDSGADLFNVAPPASILSGIYRASSNPNPPETNLLGYAYTPQSFASTFGGLGANGIWTLELMDWAGGDTGSLGGWTLNVEAVPEPATLAALGLGLPALLLRRKRAAAQKK